jgi:hypothetical protein
MAGSGSERLGARVEASASRINSRKSEKIRRGDGRIRFGKDWGRGWRPVLRGSAAKRRRCMA